MSGKKVDAKFIVRNFIKGLSDIKVDNAFVFGSYATGLAKSDSDIDCLIVSRDFFKMDFLKRLQILSRARRGLSTDVAMDIFGYTPQELAIMKKDTSPNVKKMLREMRAVC